MRRREKDDTPKVLKFKSFDEAFAYCVEKGEAVVVEIVAPAEGAGTYRIFPSGGAIRQLGESEADDEHGE